MQFTLSNRDDISRYFKGTFVKFAEFGDMLFYINSVQGNEVRGIDEDDNDFVIYLSDDVPYNVDFVLPHKAVYQHGKDVVLMQRVPARQYRRGICDENVKLIILTSNDQLEVNFKNLKAFVTKTSYSTLRDAIFGKNKNIAVAISDRFWFYKRNQCLYCLNKAIAKFSRDDAKFHIAPMFKEEIAQLVAADPWEVSYASI